MVWTDRKVIRFKMSTADFTSTIQLLKLKYFLYNILCTIVDFSLHHQYTTSKQFHRSQGLENDYSNRLIKDPQAEVKSISWRRKESKRAIITIKDGHLYVHISTYFSEILNLSLFENLIAHFRSVNEIFEHETENALVPITDRVH